MTIVVVPAAFAVSEDVEVVAEFAGLERVRDEFLRSIGADFPAIVAGLVVAVMNAGVALGNSVAGLEVVAVVDTVVLLLLTYSLLLSETLNKGRFLGLIHMLKLFTLLIRQNNCSLLQHLVGHQEIALS